ncbi:MAG TPA: hypothetical protein VGR57_00310 [Ktedonobacterales bacterium]|nr:hypothetical protein [Ktedonobacterales bacterium]
MAYSSTSTNDAVHGEEGHMGNVTILHGYIYAPNAVAERNAARIAALPDGDRWPYLTSDLFSVPRLQHTYNDYLNTFGTTFKNFDLHVGWPAWRAKFEALLRTMAWYEVQVSLDIESVGRCQFTWKQDVWHLTDWDLPQGTQRALTALREAFEKPVERWTFSGGPLEETNR